MINKHKSNKIKENSNTVRHLNNGTDRRHSKSSCDQSSPARRTKRKTNKQKRTVLVYKNTEESINKFYSDVSAAISSMPMNNDLFGNPNDSYNSLENVLMEAKVKHFQPREVNYKKYKHKYSPWITSGIIRSIKYRDLLYRKLKKNRRSIARA